MDQITIHRIPYRVCDALNCERLAAGSLIPDEKRQSAKLYGPLFRAYSDELAGNQGFLEFQIVESVPGERALSIGRVCVEPYCDARYIGKALIHAALLVAQEEGARSMFAYVENDNVHAQSFFERNSFYRTDHGCGLEYTTPVPSKEVLPLEEILIAAQ